MTMKKINITRKGDQDFATLLDLKVPNWYEKKLITHKADFLERSLKQNDFLRPIVINVHPLRAGIIIDGVQIYYVCKKLGIEEVPVFKLSVFQAEEKEYHVLLNNFISENDREQELLLMQERYYTYFDTDSKILGKECSTYELAVNDEPILPMVLTSADEAYKKEIQKPLNLSRRCMFNLPPEMSDYPEKAMEILEFKSLSKLFIQLLKFCVEDNQNEAD